MIIPSDLKIFNMKKIYTDASGTIFSPIVTAKIERILAGKSSEIA